MSKQELCWIFAGVWLLLAILLGNYPYISAFCYTFCALPLVHLLRGKLSAKASRCVRNTVAIILSVVILVFCVTGFFIGGATQGTEGEADYVIVLGTRVLGTTPTPQLEDRIDAAAEYLTVHPQTVAILSGGKGAYDTLAEAHCMRRELIYRGIDESRLILEPYATSTEENLEFSLALIEKLTGSRPDTVGILSSEYHLFRANMFAEELGVKAVTVPATTGDILSLSESFLREVIMVLYYSTIG